MNYMLLIYQEESPVLAAPLVSPGCNGLVDRLEASGHYVASGILQPTHTATSLRLREGRRLITDGPFAETREGLAGYLLIEAKDLDEALRVAAEHPVASTGTVEIRPVLFSADWASSSPENTMNTAQKSFVITRTSDAPRDLVWQAWTERDLLSQWWGPKGMGTDVLALDVRPNGTFHYAMIPAEGERSYGKFVYQEIVAPERLVFRNGFANEAGEYIRAPFGMDWPLEILTTVTFEEIDGGTRLILSIVPIDPTDAERASFEGMYESMTQGFNGTFDRLTELLALGETAGRAKAAMAPGQI